MDISESLPIEEADAPITRNMAAKSLTHIGYWNIMAMYKPCRTE